MLSHSVSLVLSLVCLWYAQISAGHRHDLENVAYSKKVTLSSRWDHKSYPGSNAVNGIFSDYAHTANERYPWMRIDLEEKFRIHEIEVFARSDVLFNGMWMFIIYSISNHNFIFLRLPFYASYFMLLWLRTCTLLSSANRTILFYYMYYNITGEDYRVRYNNLPINVPKQNL